MAMKGLHICGTRKFYPGEPPPEGYNAWHEWADVQHKAGLRQVQCGLCGLWQYPQELSDKTHSFEAFTRAGEPVTIESKICKKCAAD